MENQNEQLIKEFEKYAKDNGIQLNPNKKIVEGIVNGLLRNKEKFGEMYCPCRRVSGDKQEDAQKICPCFWHKDEIKKDGHCFCKLRYQNMIVDDIKITVTAGHGGKGMATFSKVKWALGPTGGNGGIGGNIFIEGVADLGALRQFRFKKDHYAKNGENGKSGLHDGHNAEDLTLFVPVGTVCHNLIRKEDIEITKIGQREMIAKGGRGGKGNWYFRSATNTSPRQFQEGKPGEYFEIRFELKMIADVGFVGLPNVGKSSLLNELTKANAKVANYHFTTLEPNLGAYYDLILADIPGLIEGASTGKGLGTKFLRHIERTKVLFHFVSADSANPLLDYKTVRKELETYGDILLDKPEYIFLSKTDIVSADVISKIKEDFKKSKKEIIPISIIDPNSIEVIKKILNNLIKEKSSAKA